MSGNSETTSIIHKLEEMLALQEKERAGKEDEFIFLLLQFWKTDEKVDIVHGTGPIGSIIDQCNETWFNVLEKLGDKWENLSFWEDYDPSIDTRGACLD